jgi:hypothetical protein
MFGAKPAAAPGGFGGFGTAGAASSGGFGGFGAKPAASSGGFGGFGAAGAASAGGFGGFGAKPAAAGGFGGFGAAASSGGFGGFGAKPAAAGGFGGFGAAAASSGGFGGFGAKPASSAGFGGFGAAAASSGGFGGFGAKPASSAGFGGFGGFGAKPASSAGFGGFGGFGSTSTAGFGGFGAATNAQLGGMLGGQAGAATYPNMLVMHQAEPAFDWQQSLSELRTKKGSATEDPMGAKCAELHQEMQRHISGNDGTGGMREYAGSDGSIYPVRQGKIDIGLEYERALLAEVQGRLQRHSGDMERLEGFLESEHASYEEFFQTLSRDLQVHQMLLRKQELEAAHSSADAAAIGGGQMALVNNPNQAGLGNDLGGSLALAAAEDPRVSQGRSLQHLTSLCDGYERRITELTLQVQRVQEHLETREFALQHHGSFNPLALKDAIKLQYDTFIAAGESVGSVHAQVDALRSHFAAEKGFTLGGEDCWFARADAEFYEKRNRFKKAEQLERRRLEVERDRARHAREMAQMQEQLQLVSTRGQRERISAGAANTLEPPAGPRLRDSFHDAGGRVCVL